MSEIRRVEDTVDEEGFIVAGYTAWDCDCGREIRSYGYRSEVDCECGQWYNACGNRLRSNWQSNRSNYDEDISDMDGYESSFAGDW